MMTDVRELLNKSAESIRAAELLLAGEFFSFAASRACYAMFYAAEALLLTRELSFSKHSALIAAFEEKFVKTGVFDTRYHIDLLHVFELKNTGDYGSLEAVSEQEAQQAVAHSRDLLQAIEEYLRMGTCQEP